MPFGSNPSFNNQTYQLKSNLLLQSGRRKLLDLWGRHLQDCKEFLSSLTSFSQWRGWTSTGRAVSSWSAAVTADTSTCGTSTPPASFSLWRATEEEWWVRVYVWWPYKHTWCMSDIHPSHDWISHHPSVVTSCHFLCRWTVWSHILICRVWPPAGWTTTSNCGPPQLRAPQDWRV